VDPLPFGNVAFELRPRGVVGELGVVVVPEHFDSSVGRDNLAAVAGVFALKADGSSEAIAPWCEKSPVEQAYPADITVELLPAVPSDGLPVVADGPLAPPAGIAVAFVERSVHRRKLVECLVIQRTVETEFALELRIVSHGFLLDMPLVWQFFNALSRGLLESTILPRSP
jgi:hypothetical protein